MNEFCLLAKPCLKSVATPRILQSQKLAQFRQPTSEMRAAAELPLMT